MEISNSMNWKKCGFHAGSRHYLGILYFLSQQFTMHQARAVLSFVCVCVFVCERAQECLEQGKVIQCIWQSYSIFHIAHYEDNTLNLKENYNAKKENACQWLKVVTKGCWRIGCLWTLHSYYCWFWWPMVFNQFSWCYMAEVI